MTDAMMDGITTLGRTVSGLSSTNFHYRRGPHSKTGTRCVWFGVSQNADRDSVSKMYEDVVQFDFYSTNAATLKTLAAAFDAIFDLGNLTVTGYDVILIELTTEDPLSYEDNEWRITLEYRITTTIAR